MERQHQFFFSCKAHFLLYLDINTSDKAMLWHWTGRLVVELMTGLQSASDFRFQFPRGGPCQGIPSFLRGVGSSIRSVPGCLRCPASVYFLAPQGCSISVKRYGSLGVLVVRYSRISLSGRDPQGSLISYCWPCTGQPQESHHVPECIVQTLPEI